jgi:hypothetical protein
MPCASSWIGGVDDLLDRAVVAEVDHLGAVRLQHAADDVDGRVVAVEQRRGGHEADLVVGLVAVRFRHPPSRELVRVDHSRRAAPGPARRDFGFRISDFEFPPAHPGPFRLEAELSA